MELNVLVLDDHVRGAINALLEAVHLLCESEPSEYPDIDKASEMMEFPKHTLPLNKLGHDRIILKIYHNPKHLSTPDLIENWVESLKYQNIRFDCILIDDQWGEGDWNHYGQKTLLPLLFNHYPSAHLCLFTQHSDQDQRTLSFATLLRHPTYREAGRLHYIAKDDKAGLTVLLSLLIGMKQAMRTVEQRAETQDADITSDLRNVEPLPCMVAKSPAMLQICKMVRQTAPTNASVLILGESGTGKELVAKAIHLLCPERRDNNFVKVNCAALPPNIVESELFGHERGSFTGAIKQEKGKFEQANNGTIFLNEVGDLEVHIQAKLLDVLQDKTLCRIGGSKKIELNIRVISATNQDLERNIGNRKFREDLFYRLKVITIRIPSLRHHMEDMPALVDHFLKRHPTKRLDEDAWNWLMAHKWPGNIRELENCIEKAATLCDGPTIGRNLIELDMIRQRGSGAGGAQRGDSGGQEQDTGTINPAVEERLDCILAIRHVLKQCNVQTATGNEIMNVIKSLNFEELGIDKNHIALVTDKSALLKAVKRCKPEGRVINSAVDILMGKSEGALKAWWKKNAATVINVVTARIEKYRPILDDLKQISPKHLLAPLSQIDK
jgi:DNA-binding NtrC family response regulator